LVALSDRSVNVAKVITVVYFENETKPIIHCGQNANLYNAEQLAVHTVGLTTVADAHEKVADETIAAAQNAYRLHSNGTSYTDQRQRSSFVEKQVSRVT
jgi:hypothetical protein